MVPDAETSKMVDEDGLTVLSHGELIMEGRVVGIG